MAVIRKIRTDGTTVYPITDASAVYYNADETLASTFNIIAGGGAINSRILQLLTEHELMKQKLEIGESNNQIAVCDLPANRIAGISWSATGYYLLNGRFDHWGEQSWTVYPKSGSALNFSLQGNDGNSPTENMGKNLQLALYISNQDSLIILSPPESGLGSVADDYPANTASALRNALPATMLTTQQDGVITNGGQYLIQYEHTDWIYSGNPDSDSGWETGSKIVVSTEQIYGPFNFTA